jgi:cation:H+ antiporter
MKSADFLVDGASSFAKKFGISDIVIGLTIVACGTSMPEFFTSIIAAFKGSSDIAIWNVLGSNIGNILLILGLSALVYPVIAKKDTVYKEIPYSLFLALLLFILSFDKLLWYGQENSLWIIDGILLLLTFATFLAYTFDLAKKHKVDIEDHTKLLSLPVSWIYMLWGIIGLWIGAYLLVSWATNIATYFWIPQTIIGLTIVAIGTSLPELFTSVVAAYKKKSDIAIGNVVGSNIFNISFILWATALIKPINVNIHFSSDFYVLFATTILFWWLLVFSKKMSIGRIGGGIFIIAYILYLAYLISTQVI